MRLWAWVIASYMACSHMPTEANPMLNLPTFTVFKAASKAAWAGVQHVLRAHRVVLQPELGDEHLRLEDVLDQAVVLMLAVDGEEHISIRSVHVRPSTEHRDHSGDVSVTDVVLASGGVEAALPVRGQHHVGAVDVRPVFALRQPECEHRAVFEPLG